MSLAVGDVLTAISICLATGTGLLAMAQARKATRREHTFDILLARFTGDYVANLHKVAWEWIESKHAPPTGDTRHPEISEILNLYEFIALAARRGILDPNMINDIRGGLMLTFYSYFLPYIIGLRKRFDDDAIFEHLEWYVEKYVKPQKA